MRRGATLRRSTIASSTSPKTKLPETKAKRPVTLAEVEPVHEVAGVLVGDLPEHVVVDPRPVVARGLDAVVGPSAAHVEEREVEVCRHAPEVEGWH
ncbi:hypothetical protein DW878_09920 [Olsenella sp. AM39-30AC]|nr:hypothetical protein DW878_09920 [Olsenella sp. AM39-30AC]